MYSFIPHLYLDIDKLCNNSETETRIQRSINLYHMCFLCTLMQCLKSIMITTVLLKHQNVVVFLKEMIKTKYEPNNCLSE